MKHRWERRVRSWPGQVLDRHGLGEYRTQEPCSTCEKTCYCAGIWYLIFWEEELREVEGRVGDNSVFKGKTEAPQMAQSFVTASCYDRTARDMRTDMCLQ